MVTRPVRGETGLAHRLRHGDRGDRPCRHHCGARWMRRWQARCNAVGDVMRRWMRSVAACSVAAWIVGAGATVAAAAVEEHGLSQKAVEIARPFGFPVTNSMVVTWFVVLLPLVV